MDNLQIYKKNRVNNLTTICNYKLKEYYSTLMLAINKIENTKLPISFKQNQKILFINEYNKSVSNLKKKFNNSIVNVNSIDTVNNFLPEIIKPISIKRALLVGINYTNDEKNKLYGCINDVKNIKNRLLTKGFSNTDIMELTDFTELKPTRTNILNELTKLIDATQDGDISFFSISSHGSYIKDFNKDELDGLDEYINTYDDLDILDDKLKTIILKLKKNATLFAFIDTCFSGTMLDLKYSYMNSSENDNFTENLKNLETQGSIFMISGSSENQYSMDTVIDDEPCGAGTTSLLKSLQKKPDCTWRELVTNMRDYLKTNGFEQIPQISSGKFEDIGQKVFL